MAAARRSIIGLTWKKLHNSPAVSENRDSGSPVTRSMTREYLEPLRESTNEEHVRKPATKPEEGKKKAILRRVSSVRDAFGTLRQVSSVDLDP